MIPIDLECDRLSMIVFFLQSFQACFFFSKKVWLCHDRYVCELWGGTLVKLTQSGKRCSNVPWVSVEISLTFTWISCICIIAWWWYWMLLQTDIIDGTPKRDSIQVRIWFQHQQRPLYRAACFAKIGMLVISTRHTQYKQRQKGEYIILYIGYTMYSHVITCYVIFDIYICSLVYIYNIHISQLQFLNVKLLQFRCSFIFCRSLHGQNDHNGQITDYPRISKSHLFFAWQKFMTFAANFAWSRSHENYVTVGIQWASQTGIWMDPWMCRFLSPRIQIHKSVMDAMNEINRALGKRHFSWAIRNSMEFLRPWNTMDKVRKICICIDLWIHRGVIFSKKAIRHPPSQDGLL